MIRQETPVENKARPVPEISVLMPVRDGERWIAASIESILTQTFPDFELLIVDDGSTDATPAIVARHAKKDARIIVLRQPATGLVAALNNGLAAARAPLLARLDADDIAEPTRLREQADEMNRNPRLVLLGSWATEIDARGQPCGTRRPEIDNQKLGHIFDRTNPMIHSSIMLRTQTARAVGGYRVAFTAAEDFDLWLRLREQGDVANLARELVRYRVHGESVTTRSAFHQMLSARLAQRSAALRASAQTDTADTIHTAFDLWESPPRAYAEIVSIYRQLAWVDSDSMPPAHRGKAPDFSILTNAKLTRRERLLGQKAIWRYVCETPSAPRMALFLTMMGLGPLNALRLISKQAVGRKRNPA